MSKNVNFPLDEPSIEVMRLLASAADLSIREIYQEAVHNYIAERRSDPEFQQKVLDRIKALEGLL